MKDINLMPSYFRKDEKKKGLGKDGIIGLVLAVIVIVSAGLYVYLYLEIEDAERYNQELTAKKEKYLAVDEIQTKLKKQILVIEDVNYLIQNKQFQMVLNTENIDTISKAMPENVFVINYSSGDDNSLSMNGISSDNYGIAYFIRNLINTNEFDNVEINGFTKRENDNGDTLDYSFNISLTLTEDK